MQRLVDILSKIFVFPGEGLTYLPSDFGLRCVIRRDSLQAEQRAINHQQFRISDYYRLRQSCVSQVIF